MTENWKAVPGHEGRYEVSDQGRVRSVTRAVLNTQKSGAQYAFVAKGKVLAPCINTQRGGYALVVLSSGGVCVSWNVSKLVALAFLGPRPNDLYILHGDGDPLNNSIANLRYGTQKENMADALLHGTVRRGEKHAFAKLSERAVSHIRDTPKGHGTSALAKLYGVSESHISHVKAGRSWRAA
jgi:hypothetical protein